MICEFCSGSVTWRGSIAALTHTQCDKCGAKNSQIQDPAECEVCDGHGIVGSMTPDGFDPHPCPECNENGSVS